MTIRSTTPLFRARLAGAILLSAACAAVAAEPDARLTIHVDRPGHAVSPSLYGLFFEEINRAGDGGLYAEMLPNRSFEDDGMKPAGWSVQPADGSAGTTAIDASTDPATQNRNSLRLNATGVTGEKPLEIGTDGFQGLAVKAGESYKLSLNTRAKAFGGKLTASIRRRDGSTLASATVPTPGDDWKASTLTLTPTDTAADARFVLSVDAPGTVWLDMVSLFPAKTWNDSGLRTDLASMLDALKPGFLRFPGGCWVEGDTMLDAYRWKTTLGPVENRRTAYNLWKYWSTNGLGYHEYLQLCENLKCAPLYVVNVGMSHKTTIPMNRMGEYVQDALDAVEYANGSVDTTWGALRAKNGHPAPFNLKYLEIGNENGGPAYDERYALFYDAMKAKWPDVKLIANEWHGRPKSRPIEIIDEHYYNTPAWFLRHADLYDTYDRKGPKVYVGEYAVTSGGVGAGNLRSAVSEAAFMTGLERNSDIVEMASYAPLFSNVHYKVWNPNAINFDAARSYGTPSYHVQQMFASNRPDVVLPFELQTSELKSEHTGSVGVGTWTTQAQFKDLKVTTPDGKVLFDSNQSDAKPLSGQWNTQDHVLSQTGNAEGAYAVADLPAGTAAYSFTLKAKKTGGAEGFLIRFHSADAKHFTFWNLAGWGNTRSAIQISDEGGRSEASPAVNTAVETGKWYDVRVDVTGDGADCYLDGKFVQTFKYGSPREIFAAAGRAGDDVIVKLINGTSQPRVTTVTLDGLAGESREATVDTLTHNDPYAENSLDAPTKVVPVRSTLKIDSNTADMTLPAQSVTVLRVSGSAK